MATPADDARWSTEHTIPVAALVVWYGTRTVKNLLAKLSEIVGPKNILTERDVVAGYERDWTGRFVGSTPAVVRPATTEEVAASAG